MRRFFGWFMILGLVVTVLPFNMGCVRKPAHGKLQILFSGNMLGNPKPCG